MYSLEAPVFNGLLLQAVQLRALTDIAGNRDDLAAVNAPSATG